jgi:arylsulfatase A-like enzyme
VRLGDWKLIEFFEDNKIELYNLREDIGETNNLVSSHSKKAEELQKLLNKWRKSVNAQVPSSNPDYISIGN